MDLKGMTMRVSGRGIKVVLAVAVAALANGVASAQTFATFGQIDPNLNPVRFVNDGVNSRFGTYDALGNLSSVPVTFFYTIPSFIGEGSLPDAGAITATMTISSIARGTGAAFGESVFQNLRAIDITFRLNDPEYGPGLQNKILLRVTGALSLPPINGPASAPVRNGSLGTTGLFSGQEGANAAGITASESLGGPNYVGYASELLNFNQNYNSRNFSLSITDILPTVGPNDPNADPPTNGLRLGISGFEDPNYVRSFQASMTGLFASDPQPLVPEPASIAFLLPVAACIGWGVRKRKR